MRRCLQQQGVQSVGVWFAVVLLVCGVVLCVGARVRGTVKGPRRVCCIRIRVPPQISRGSDRPIGLPDRFRFPSCPVLVLTGEGTLYRTSFTVVQEKRQRHAYLSITFEDAPSRTYIFKARHLRSKKKSACEVNRVTGVGKPRRDLAKIENSTFNFQFAVLLGVQLSSIAQQE